MTGAVLPMRLRGRSDNKAGGGALVALRHQGLFLPDKLLLPGREKTQYLPAAVAIGRNRKEMNRMTESEMNLIHDLFSEYGETLVTFDERTSDKTIIFVTQDEPTMLRYILASPIPTQAQKERAKSELESLMEDDASVSTLQQMPFEEDDRVMYCAPNFGIGD
jgi:hypothetical protein